MIWRPIVEWTACLENYILPTTVLFHSSTVQLSLPLTTSSSKYTRWRLSNVVDTLKLENSSADRNISERATNNGLTVCQYNSFHIWSVEKYFELPTQNRRSYFYRIFIQMQNKDWQMYKCRNETLFPLVVPRIVADWQAADPLPSPHSVSEVFCFLFLRFCLFCSTYCQQNLWKKHTTPYFGWNASPKRNVGEKIMFDGTSRDCFCHTVIFVNFLIKIK